MIDEKSNELSTFREDLSVAGNVCDLLILYSPKNSSEKTLCLVELKSGDDFEKGVNQVINTYSNLKGGFRKDHLSKINWKGYVFARICSSPQNMKKSKAKLQNAFGKKSGWIDGKENIGDILRS